FRCIVAICLAICFVDASALTLDELRVAYRAKILRISQDKEETLDQLRGSFIKMLGKTEAEFQKSGKLQDVLLVKEQVKLVESKVWPLPGQTEGDPRKLVSGRKIFDKAYIEREREAAEKLVAAGNAMKEALEKKIVALTKSGDIEKATEANKLFEETRTNETLRDANNFLARVGRNGSGPPACRIRRFGDGIEVMVHYDKVGKISLNSPIENVIEITGGKQERGETKAKVLGEFVGSKGYEPDPRVLFQNDLSKKDLGLVFTAFSKELNVKIGDGESGLKVTLIPNAVNPHITVDDVSLPPVADAGSYEVTCSYYLPKNNKKIVGFSWNQGSGAPIEKFVFEKKGQWVTKTVSTDSINHLLNLRLYVKFKPGTVLKDAVGDSLFLKMLEVKQTTFSTYIISKYDESGQVTETFPDTTTQKKLTLGGKLVSP
ncbi:hypothetical protein N8194_03050, partial [Akkermansiaceae bacterium]|nr:hypothetical protein [Akkermansiaceae bacterium]